MWALLWLCQHSCRCVRTLVGVSSSLWLCQHPSWCVITLVGVSEPLLVCQHPCRCVSTLVVVSAPLWVCQHPCRCVSTLVGVSAPLWVCQSEQSLSGCLHRICFKVSSDSCLRVGNGGCGADTRAGRPDWSNKLMDQDRQIGKRLCIRNNHSVPSGSVDFKLRRRRRSRTYFETCTFQSVWPDLANMRHNCKILKSFGNFIWVYLKFGKIWSHFGNNFSQSFNVINVQILNSNLAIWIHWFPFTYPRYFGIEPRTIRFITANYDQICAKFWHSDQIFKSSGKVLRDTLASRICKYKMVIRVIWKVIFYFLNSYLFRQQFCLFSTF